MDRYPENHFHPAMFLKTFAINARKTFKCFRARIVPATIIMLLMMVLAVGFLTDSASAATADAQDSGAIAGGPLYMWVLLIIAIACLILWKISDEEILLYAFVGLLIATFVLFIVG
jgi:hypothetical protein